MKELRGNSMTVDAVEIKYQGSDVHIEIDTEEIEGLNPVGDFILCTMCGNRHIIRFGKEEMEDGTMVESKKIGFITCKSNDYIVSLNGKDIRAPLEG